MVVEDDILSFMRMRGPSLPADVAKAIKTNIMIAGAHLSDLISKGKVKITSLKIGGSPLYYLLGQENKIQDFASNLNDKDYKAYELLKQNRILRDNAQEPIIRVALRSIKDFAVPLNVKFGEATETFWKWYATSDSEATMLIKMELGVKDEKEEKQEKLVKEEITENKLENEKENEIKEIKTENITQKIKMPRIKTAKKKITLDGFTAEIKKLFDEKHIRVIEEEILKKDNETNYIIEMPSPLGNLLYFCKARNKKSCNEKDISSALIEGQIKKLPAVFLYNSLTKKAEEIKNTDAFKTMLFYSLKR